MRNNKGFGKYEVLTVIVLLLIVGCVISYNFLGGTSSQKIETMKNSANNFSKAATTNMSSFHNSETVYLQEVIDEKFMKNIKNPVGGGNCSTSESFVHLENGMPYVTLKCGNLLIDQANFTDNKQVDVYKISSWSDTKGSDTDEERVLYNCIDNDKEIFDEYYDELYFVYEINKKYNTNYFFASSVNECKVVSKTFYRDRETING